MSRNDDRFPDQVRGSAPVLPNGTAVTGTAESRAALGEPVELVLLDVGGPVYDDSWYREALLRATCELVAENGGMLLEAEFQRVYDARRQSQEGSLRTAMAEHFLRDGDRERLSDRAESYWFYPPSALHPDVLPALRQLSERYSIAVVANQRALVVDALRRDGVAPFIDHWAISELVGATKPDPEIFWHALNRAGVLPRNAVHVGNRLDSDVRGAQRLGMRTIWVVRGEAPPDPTPEQLGEPDIAVFSLADVPAAVERLQRAR
ncbi:MULTISPECIES: HAD family hydrolase [unclassified Saccharopolyspora]|uniref:HAD family hydrolase n=1 Tax=unclassified Saccharopolyspora TaxID=2646250 RepID=UPI001CD50C02|nr:MULTISPECIES: HAD family hydrolase [unclassified Saccharopolyspora]MCA1193894.1 HAD family hydrolase [Saccharopolyspora sp. 6V]MCA1229099.1 HAD family hydrolase [Saccharopolyspora sp. 6M]MCA1282959.1 HAD family hydrolase [Saccharopolyspora sp. 7B]